MGDVMLWRCDASGWHQLLRKLKRDNSGSIGTYGVLSLHMHPDKVCASSSSSRNNDYIIICYARRELL